MSVKNIQGSGIPDKPVKKTENNTTPEKSRAVERPASVRRDRVEITGQKFADEIAFARSALSKMDENRMETLQGIRRKIDQGHYDSPSVREEVDRLFRKDLTGIESYLLSSDREVTDPDTVRITPPDESRMEFLMNDEEVSDKVSERILSDLKKLK